jgi:hypothetical protein
MTYQPNQLDEFLYRISEIVREPDNIISIQDLTPSTPIWNLEEARSHLENIIDTTDLAELSPEDVALLEYTETFLNELITNRQVVLMHSLTEHN